MAYGITDKSQMIDKETINRGCNKIDEVARDFVVAARKIYGASGVLTKDALSMDNNTMQATVREVADFVDKCEDTMLSYTASIRQVVNEIYKAQEKEYNNYLLEKSRDNE